MKGGCFNMMTLLLGGVGCSEVSPSGEGTDEGDVVSPSSSSITDGSGSTTFDVTTYGYGIPTVDVVWAPADGSDEVVVDQWVEAVVVGTFGSACTSTHFVTGVEGDDPLLGIHLWFPQAASEGALFTMPSVSVFAEDDRRANLPIIWA